MPSPPFLKSLLSKDTKSSHKGSTPVQVMSVSNDVIPITATEEVAREVRRGAEAPRSRTRTQYSQYGSSNRNEPPISGRSTSTRRTHLETSQTAFLPNGLLKLPSPCNITTTATTTTTSVPLAEEGGAGSLNSTCNTDQQAPVAGASILYSRRRTGTAYTSDKHLRSPQSQSQMQDQRARWRLDETDETGASAGNAPTNSNNNTNGGCNSGVPSASLSRRATPPPPEVTRRGNGAAQPVHSTSNSNNCNNNSHSNHTHRTGTPVLTARDGGGLQHVTINTSNSTSSRFDSKMLRARRGASEDAWSSDMCSERYGSEAPTMSGVYSQPRRHDSDRSTAEEVTSHNSRRVQGAKAVLRRHARNTSMNASTHSPHKHSLYQSTNGQLHRTWSNSGLFANGDGRSVTSISHLSRLDSAQNNHRYHRRASPSPSQPRVPTFPSMTHLEYQVVVTPTTSRSGLRHGARVNSQSSGNPLDTHTSIVAAAGMAGTNSSALMSNSNANSGAGPPSARRLAGSSRMSDATVGIAEQPLIEMLEISPNHSRDPRRRRRPDSPETLTLAYSGGSHSTQDYMSSKGGEPERRRQGAKEPGEGDGGVATTTMSAVNGTTIVPPSSSSAAATPRTANGHAHSPEHDNPAAAAAAALIVVAAKRQQHRQMSNPKRHLTTASLGAGDESSSAAAAAAAAALANGGANGEFDVRRVSANATHITPRRRSRREMSMSMGSDTSSTASYAERHRKNVDKLLAHLGHDTSRSNVIRQQLRLEPITSPTGPNGSLHTGAWPLGGNGAGSESEAEAHSGRPSRVHSPTTTSGGGGGWTGIGGGGLSTTEDWYAHLRRKFAEEGDDVDDDNNDDDGGDAKDGDDTPTTKTEGNTAGSGSGGGGKSRTTSAGKTRTATDANMSTTSPKRRNSSTSSFNNDKNTVVRTRNDRAETKGKTGSGAAAAGEATKEPTTRRRSTLTLSSSGLNSHGNSTLATANSSASGKAVTSTTATNNNSTNSPSLVKPHPPQSQPSHGAFAMNGSWRQGQRGGDSMNSETATKRRSRVSLLSPPGKSSTVRPAAEPGKPRRMSFKPPPPVVSLTSSSSPPPQAAPDPTASAAAASGANRPESNTSGSGGSTERTGGRVLPPAHSTTTATTATATTTTTSTANTTCNNTRSNTPQLPTQVTAASSLTSRQQQQPPPSSQVEPLPPIELHHTSITWCENEAERSSAPHHSPCTSLATNAEASTSHGSSGAGGGGGGGTSSGTGKEAPQVSFVRGGKPGVSPTRMQDSVSFAQGGPAAPTKTAAAATTAGTGTHTITGTTTATTTAAAAGNASTMATGTVLPAAALHIPPIMEHHDSRARQVTVAAEVSAPAVVGGGAAANGPLPPRSGHPGGAPGVQTRLRSGGSRSAAAVAIAAGRPETAGTRRAAVEVVVPTLMTLFAPAALGPGTEATSSTANGSSSTNTPRRGNEVTPSPDLHITNRRSSRKVLQSSSLLDTMRHSLTRSYASLGDTAPSLGGSATHIHKGQ